MICTKNSIRRTLYALAALLAYIPITYANDLTAVDAQGVIYDKISGTHDVIISAANSTQFRNSRVNLVIPPVITDTSTDSEGGDFNVIGMSARAFQSTAITGIEITAPLTEIPEYAFVSCGSLASVKLPATVKTIQQSAFSSCYSLTSFEDEGPGLETIGQYAFNYCNSLPKFESTSVKKVDNNAFYNCSQLLSVNLPVVETLGASAFYQCYSLTTAVLNDNLKEIPGSAFGDCEKLTNMTLPSSLEKIGYGAFSGCEALTITNQWPESLKIIEGSAFSYCKAFGDLIIPGNARIDNQVFKNSRITSITWPEDASTIGEGCFDSVTGLIETTLPSWMKIMPKAMFRQSSLQTVTFGAGLEEVGEEAFYYCQSLTKVNVNNGLKKILKRAFYYCSSLAEFNIVPGVYLYEESLAYTALTHIEFPEEPMYCYNLEKEFLTAPFRYMTKLESITTPAYMTEIAEFFLGNCSALKEADLSSVEEISKYALAECKNLTNVTLGPKLKTIYRYAFQNCTSLEFIRITANEYVDKYAFSGCSKLTRLEIGNAFVEYNAVPDFSKMTSIKFFGENARLGKRIGTGYMLQGPSDITFEEGVKRIGEHSFDTWYCIKELNLPSTVEVIERGAFMHLNLSTLTLPESVKEVCDSAFFDAAAPYYATSTFKVRPGMKIGKHAFEKCKCIQHIEFPEIDESTPELIPEIGEYAFAQTKTEEFTAPLWMTKIPKGLLFLEHNHQDSKQRNFLKSVVLHDNVTEIGDSAFYGGVFSEIILPKNPCKLGKYCLADNREMTSITLPDYVTELPEGLFRWSFVLRNVNLENVTRYNKECLFKTMVCNVNQYADKIEFIGTRAFYEISNGLITNGSMGEIVIPETVELEKSSFERATFSKIVFTGCRKSFPPMCFYQTDIADGIFLPDCMEEISDSMFMGTRFYREDFHVGPNVRRIGKSAFQGATFYSLYDYISQIVIPESVEIIDDHAFDGAFYGDQYRGFNYELVLPKTHNVKLGKYAFARCGRIKEIVIPATYDSIPEGCFCMGKGGYGFNNNYSIDADGDDEGKINTTKYPQLIFEPRNENQKKLHLGGYAVSDCGGDLIDLTDLDLTLDRYAFAKTPIKELRLPGVEVIPEQCFLESPIKKLVLSEGTVEVKDSAFRLMRNIKELELPSTLRIFGNRAGYSVNKLISVKFNGCDSIGTNAFENCYYLTDVNLSEDTRVIEDFAFYNCFRLPKIKIPNSTLKLKTNTFKKCSALKTVDLGTGLQEIEKETFMDLAVENLTWCPAIKIVRERAFKNTQIVNLDFGEGFDPTPYFMYSDIFSSCKKLETVTIRNSGENPFGPYMFAECDNLKSVTLNPNIKRIPKYAFYKDYNLADIDISNVTTLEDYAFYWCYALPSVKFSPELTKIPNYCFDSCTSLASAEFNNDDMELGASAFSSCSALQNVEFSGKVKIGGSAFSYCSSLKKVKTGGIVSAISGYAFRGCTNLEEVDLPDKYSLLEISHYAFKDCSSLREFPYLEYCKKNNSLGSVFENATSLQSIVMPREGDFVDNMYYGWVSCSDMLKNTTSLHSITFPHTEPQMYLWWNDIQNAPLDAVSYCYATDIPVYPTWRIYEFSNNYNPMPEQENKSLLYVKRGQKWKYIERGYGKKFNIIEMKDPQVNVYGSIYSAYDITKNVNHYKGSLRWELTLSDLDTEKPTVVEIYRQPVYNTPATANLDDEDNIQEYVETPEKVKIATVSFSVPVLCDDAPDYLGQQVYKVVATIDSKSIAANYSGNYEFPITDYDGNLDHYFSVNATQRAELYFDAVSEKRLNSFDTYNQTSWFLLLDEFDSPELTQKNVPLTYQYTATVAPYSYKKYVNNDKFELKNDLRYHEEWDTTSAIESEPMQINVATAIPTIDFDGIYSYDTVVADLKMETPVSTPHSADKKYKLGWNIESIDDGKYGITEDGDKYDIFTSLDFVELDLNNNRKYIKQNLPLNEKAGKLYISNLSDVKANMKYQIVLHSPTRGDFCSPALTIPDAPELCITKISLFFAQHCLADVDGHDDLHYKATIEMEPKIDRTGWESGMPSHGDFHIGAWRSIINPREIPTNGKMKEAAIFDADDENTQLAHHVDGHVDEETACSDCNEERYLTTTDDKIILCDVFTQPKTQTFDVQYNNRLYIKVPQEMIPGEERWMLADAESMFPRSLYTNLEDIYNEIQASDEEVLWYDINGLRVKEPINGEFFIRVTKTKAELIRF